MERFTITRVSPGITVSRELFLVEDDLTGRIREATNDLRDAQAVAAWLNAGNVYAGGEPVLVSS